MLFRNKVGGASIPFRQPRINARLYKPLINPRQNLFLGHDFDNQSLERSGRICGREPPPPRSYAVLFGQGFGRIFQDAHGLFQWKVLCHVPFHVFFSVAFNPILDLAIRTGMHTCSECMEPSDQWLWHVNVPRHNSPCFNPSEWDIQYY
jgi:hypothetical protein